MTRSTATIEQIINNVYLPAIIEKVGEPVTATLSWSVMSEHLNIALHVKDRAPVYVVMARYELQDTATCATLLRGRLMEAARTLQRWPSDMRPTEEAVRSDWGAKE